MGRPRKPKTPSPRTKNRHARLRIDARRVDLDRLLRMGFTHRDLLGWLETQEDVQVDEAQLRHFLEHGEADDARKRIDLDDKDDDR